MKRIALLVLCLLPCVSGLPRAASAPLVPMVAAPVTTHVLWTNANGQISLWNYHDDGTYTYTLYGPYPGWTAKTISDGPDGRQRVLWVYTDGSVSLWSLDNTTGAFTHAEFGPYPGWTAATLSTASAGVGGAAGGDLFGLYPNPTIAPNAVDHTKLASDAASLSQVSGGLLYNLDGSHTQVLHDLQVHGTVITLDGNGGGSGNNSGVARALVDGGPANNLIINYANDFGRVSVQSELDVHGALGLEPGDIYANNDINIHRNTTVHGTFGVQGGNFGVDGAVNLGDGNINSANKINLNKDTAVNGNLQVSGAVDVVGYISTQSTMYAKSLQLNGGSDLAEPYKIAPAADLQPAPGLVVSIDPARTGQMRVTTHAYDDTVGGIISGANGIQPGIVLRQAGTIADGTLPIASAGRVWCWCDAGPGAGGAISPGNLLTTSDTPGHAMRVRDHDRARGAIIGKAMSSLPTGKGLVLVLVTLE